MKDKDAAELTGPLQKWPQQKRPRPHARIIPDMFPQAFSKRVISRSLGSLDGSMLNSKRDDQPSPGIPRDSKGDPHGPGYPMGQEDISHNTNTWLLHLQDEEPMNIYGFQSLRSLSAFLKTRASLESACCPISNFNDICLNYGFQFRICLT